MIELEGVGYRYPGGDGRPGRQVLAGVDLEVEPGEMLLVVGPSGAGKSSLLRTLNGLVPHFHGGRLTGRIRVAGLDPVAEGPRGMSEHVGFVMQDPESQLVTVRVEDELAFAMENAALPRPLMRKRVEEVLDQLSIAALRHRRLDTLSGGERQRVAIGSVLTLQPSILVLDEPTSQLDPQGAEEVLAHLRRLNEDLGLTVVLAEHRLDRVAHHADRVLLLTGPGEPPVVGSPREVLGRMEHAPPLVALGRELGWAPLPLTIKEARRPARALKARLDEASAPAPAGGAPPGARPSNRHRGAPSGENLETVADTGAAEPPVVLEARGLWHRYAGAEPGGGESLRGVDLTLRRGERLALMGRNGSGKSTLLKCLVGLEKPYRGHIRVLGMDPAKVPLGEMARRVGFVPQNPSRLLFRDTVAEELAFRRDAEDGEARPHLDPSTLLDRLGLRHLADAYPRDLAVGERQRVALGAVLANGPEVLLLDEPTRGLDARAKDELAALLTRLAEDGLAICLASHDVELVARFADRVMLLGDGEKIAEGPVEEVMTASTVFTPQINKLLRDPRFLTVEDVLGALRRAGRGAQGSAG